MLLKFKVFAAADQVQHLQEFFEPELQVGHEVEEEDFLVTFQLVAVVLLLYLMELALLDLADEMVVQQTVADVAEMVAQQTVADFAEVVVEQTAVVEQTVAAAVD